MVEMGDVTIWIYILECSNGSFYTGTYRGDDIDTRVGEHNSRKYANAYTGRYLPVRLVWCTTCETINEAVAFERQIKGWSRAKKAALISGDYDALPGLSRNRQPRDTSS
tara:strand:+ start:341 stop:667 length:327 start_codon:yes stop_codon:yes gene_type:complete